MTLTSIFALCLHSITAVFLARAMAGTPAVRAARVRRKVECLHVRVKGSPWWKVIKY
jgi:hypothetical protein